MIIDFHNHIGRSVDETESRAEDLIRLLDRAGIARSVVFAIDTEEPGVNYETENDKILEACGRYPGRFIPFCRVYPGKQGAVPEMRRCAKNGFRGLKLHPRSDGFSFRECGEVLEEALRLDWPVMLHTERRRWCEPLEWEETFRRFGTLKFILAHSGKDNFKDAGMLAQKYANVFLDTTTLSYNRTKVLLKAAGPDKLLYGSDYPYSHPEIELKKYSLLLPEGQARRKVFGENAAKILGKAG